jgi:hypothetical protein
MQQENFRENAEGQRLEENIHYFDGAQLLYILLNKEQILIFTFLL